MASLLIHSLPLLLKSLVVTIQIALISIAIGLLGGISLGILNCRKLRYPISGALINAFVWIIRGTPLFVQVLVVYYALPEFLHISFSPFVAGVIALGINSTAYLSEVIRLGLDAIPEGQWEAAYVLGLNIPQTLRKIILPQVFRMTFPGLTNELTSLIKETSILMVIGVTELTKVSKDIVARELDPMTIYLAAAGLYLLLTSIVTMATQNIKKRWSI